MRRPVRIAAIGLLVTAAVAAGAFWGLRYLAPGYVDQPPALTPVPPLPPTARTSLIVVPIFVPLATIQEAIENGIPKDLAGRPEFPLPPVLASAELTYSLAREPFVITAAAEGFSLTAELRGSLRAAGLPTGALPDPRGRGEPRFGPPMLLPPPPGFPMPPGMRGMPPGAGGVPAPPADRAQPSPPDTAREQAAALGGRIAVTVKPELKPDWRLEPNLTAQVSISEATLSVMGTTLSLSNEMRPALEGMINQQLATLQTRLNENPMLEQSARRAWADMCRSIPLGAGAAGANLWLEFRPVEAHLGQPRIDQSGVALTLGTRAETRVVPAETRPECAFPQRLQIVPPSDQGRVNIDMPIDIPFAEATRLIEAQLKGKTFAVNDAGDLKATIQRVTLRASGDRILLSVGVKANETRSWLGLAADATIHVWGRPSLDRERRSLRFEDIAVDVESEAAFGVLGFVARAAVPYLRKAISDNATIDLAPLLANAREAIEGAAADFRRNADGVTVDTTVADVRLAGIQFDNSTLRVIAEADGAVRVTVTRLAPR